MLQKTLDLLRSIFSKNKINPATGLSKLQEEKIKTLEKFLGFKTNRPEYFIKALTHRSYLEIDPTQTKSNERLEFLGDSVLGMIVAKYLFKRYPDEGEGFLTKARSHMVSREALADAAESMNFKKYLLYDTRFVKDSEEGMRTIMSDALEAIIGAIYFDQGLKKAEQFIFKWIIKPNVSNGTVSLDRNYKGQLLEYTHANKLDAPRYVLQKTEGPEHKKEFTIGVFIGGEMLGIGTGGNKKSAEQEASQKALEKLLGQ